MLQRYFEVIIFKNYSRHLCSVSFGTLETIFIQFFFGWVVFTPLETTRNCNFTLRGKEKSFALGGNRTTDLQMRSTVTLPTELRGRTARESSSYGSMIPLNRANDQWVIHGLTWHFKSHFRVNSLFHQLCS